MVTAVVTNGKHLHCYQWQTPTLLPMANTYMSKYSTATHACIQLTCNLSANSVVLILLKACLEVVDEIIIIIKHR